MPAHIRATRKAEREAEERSREDRELRAKLERERRAWIADYDRLTSGQISECREIALERIVVKYRAKHAASPPNTGFMRQQIVMVARDRGMVGGAS